MPRKKRITTEEFLEDDHLEHREMPVDPRIVQDDTLDYALKQFDDRNGLELKYYLGQPGGSAFIGGYPDIIPESQLQDWYPQGGKFEVRIYVHGEFRDRRFMMIAARPGGSSHTNGNGAGSEFLQQQIQMLNQKIDLMNRQPQVTPVGELATAVSTIFNLAKPQQDLPIDRILDVLKMGMELGKGGSADDGGFMGTVKEIVKEAGPGIIQGLMASKTGPAVNIPSAIPVVTGEERMNMMARQGIAFLKKKALAGADPGLYIDFAVDNRDNELFQPILAAILAPDSKFEVFTSIDAEIGQPPYVEFFRAIYDGLRSAFSESNPVVPAGSGPTGNVSDSGSHAKPRKAGSQ